VVLGGPTVRVLAVHDPEEELQGILGKMALVSLIGIAILAPEAIPAILGFMALSQAAGDLADKIWGPNSGARNIVQGLLGLGALGLGARGVEDPVVDEEPPASQNDSNFRQRIDEAPNQAAADDVRYERYQARGGQMDREEWQAATDRLRANQAQGRADEDNALNDLGIENNNYNQTSDGQPRDIVRYTSDDGVSTRPDGVTDSHWVDVKSQSEGTVYYTQQLRAESEGAQSDGGKELGVIISNDDASAVRPSGPLADNATVLHNDPQTGQWSVWDTSANDGDGGWSPITQGQAKSLLNGPPPNDPSGGDPQR